MALCTYLCLMPPRFFRDVTGSDSRLQKQSGKAAHSSHNRLLPKEHNHVFPIPHAHSIMTSMQIITDTTNTKTLQTTYQPV